MKKFKILVIALIISIAAGFCFYFFYYTKTPTYSITQIVSSIKNKDEQTFNKYADLDSVIYFSIDEILSSQIKEMTSEESTMIKSFAKLFQKPLAEKLTEYTRATLFSKQPVEQMQSTSNENSIFKNMENKLKPNKLIFKNANNVITADQNSQMDITLFDEKLNKDFVFTAHMKKMEDGTWKLIKISNTAKYFQQLVEDKNKSTK